MLTASFRLLRPPPRSQPHLWHPWPPLTPHSQACSESCCFAFRSCPGAATSHRLPGPTLSSPHSLWGVLVWASHRVSQFPPLLPSAEAKVPSLKPDSSAALCSKPCIRESPSPYRGLCSQRSWCLLLSHLLYWPLPTLLFFPPKRIMWWLYSSCYLKKSDEMVVMIKITRERSGPRFVLDQVLPQESSL